MAYTGIRRNVFISFYGENRSEVDAFIRRWSIDEKVFQAKALGTIHNDDFINSTNPDYVMEQIRKKYIQDSTVTIVLLGSCTHSRRYIDWEIKASLTQGEDYLPNGLIGILLPSQGERCHLPPRFKSNWDAGNSKYARYYVPPSSGESLGSWIEDAFNARTSRAKLIDNPRDMMGNNAQCEVHTITHPAG
jgi:hypothetical protein